MGKHIMIRILVVVCFIFIGIKSYHIYKDSHSKNAKDFVNKIGLFEKDSVAFDGIIEKDWSITEQGKLICVSLAANKVYSKIYCVDLLEGKITDSLQMKKRFNTVKSIKKGNTIYFIFDREYLYLVDSDTLEVKNIFHDKKKRYYNQNVIIYNDTMITSDNSSHISVIDLNSGNVIASKRVVMLRFLDIHNGILFYSLAGYNVYAVDPKTLDLIWKYVERGEHVSTNIVFKGEYLFFNNNTRTIIFNALTGEKINEYALWATEIYLVDNDLYAYILGHNVYRADKENGNILWEIEVYTNHVNVIGDYIFFKDNDENSINKVNRLNGQLIWRTAWYGGYKDKIIETNKYTIIQNREGQIYLLNKDTGDKLWRFSKILNEEKAFWTKYKKHLIISNGANEIFIYDVDTGLE